jgi:hypothetical protein
MTFREADSTDTNTSGSLVLGAFDKDGTPSGASAAEGGWHACTAHGSTDGVRPHLVASGRIERSRLGLTGTGMSFRASENPRLDLSSIYGSTARSRASAVFIKETRTGSAWTNLVHGPTSGVEAQIIDVDLFSKLEEEKYEGSSWNTSAPTLGTSFWLAYAKIRLTDQIKVVIPLLLYMFAFGAVVLKEDVDTGTGIVASAMVLFSVGLALFLEGLKLGVMPLGEVVGKTLPVKCPMWVTLCVCFFLGMAYTFAEPALGALQEAGDAIDTFKSPYVYYLLNQWEQYVVIMAGSGVGMAAVVGTLRFTYGISIKPVILGAVSLALSLTLLGTYMNDGTSQIIGLAWDCGVVTTGPVTVPILLALGLGITGATKNTQQPDLTVSQSSVMPAMPAAAEGVLEGFGIVTLASLFPVAGVYLLAFVLTNIKSVDGILTEVHGKCYRIDEVACNSAMACDWDDIASRCEVGESAVDVPWYEETPFAEIQESVVALAPLVLLLVSLLRLLGEPLPLLSVRAHDCVDEITVWGGLVCTLVGLMMFNVGLTQGLSVLGSDIGEATPRAFDPTDGYDDTPYFEKGYGITLSLVFVGFLGMGTTLAEPALSALVAAC